MLLLRACTYRYFASGPNPKRSLWLRIGLGLAGLSLFGWVVYRSTARILGSLLPVDSIAQAGFVFLLAGVCTSALFILTHVAYRNYSIRSEVVYYLAIPSLHAKLLRAYMYIPLGAAGLVVAMALASKLTILPVAEIVLICLVGVGGVGAAQALIRGAGYSGLAQVIALGQAGGGMFVASQTLTSRQTPLLLWTGLSVAIHILCILLAMRLPIRWGQASQGKGVVAPFKRLGLITMVLATAFRNTRFRHALLTWVGMSAILLLAALALPGTMPFDAAAMGSLLLVGVIGQEVRSLWGRRYPVPLVLYGDVWRWHSGNWLVATMACMVAAGLVLLADVVFFAGNLGAGMGYVVCMALCLGAAGSVAGNILVPERSDIVSQIGSAVLYVILAWCVVRLLAIGSQGGMGGAMATAACLIAGSFGMGWVAERIRWNKTMKGNYANIFRI